MITSVITFGLRVVPPKSRWAFLVTPAAISLTFAREREEELCLRQESGRCGRGKNSVTVKGGTNSGRVLPRGICRAEGLTGPLRL